MSVLGPRPCPYCSKTKYKEPVALLQHILDAHPDEEIPKQLHSRYRFPCKCEHCNCSMQSAIALLGHYASVHREAADRLYDFLFSNTAPRAGGDHVEVITDRDTEGLQIAERVLEGEMSVCLVPEQGQTTIITGRGICRFTDAGIHAANIYNILKTKAHIIVFGSIESQDSIAALLGKEAEDFVGPDWFLSMDFITHISVSVDRDPYRMLQTYLISKQFYGTGRQKFACPVCNQEYEDRLGVYRCLFKKHPFPQYVMGQFKTDSHEKNKFICCKCHIDAGDYDRLIQHVYDRHREVLINRVLKECNTKPEPDSMRVKHFFDQELSGADDAPIKQLEQPMASVQPVPVSQGVVVDPAVAQGYVMAPTVAQGVVVDPTVAQGYVMAPTVAQGVVVDPTVAQGYVMAPTGAQGPGIGPTVAQGPGIGPTVAQGVVVDPTVAQGPGIGPTVAQGYVFDPSVPPGFQYTDDAGTVHVGAATMMMQGAAPQ